MKLKRLLSLAGFLAAILIFTGGRLQAANLIDVGDAQAFAGGNDTVDVFVTMDSAFVGAQVTLSFDKSVLSYKEGSLVYNQTAWNPAWGAPQVGVDTAAGTVTVAFLSLTNIDAALPRTSVSLKLFSVVLVVDSTVTTGTKTISATGIFTTRTANYDLVTYNISGASVLTGNFLVQSSYTIEVDSVVASPGIATAVPVYLTNVSKANGVQFTIAYDSSQVYYAGTTELNSAVWAGGTPEVPLVTDLGDSVKVSLYSLSATANIPLSNDPQWIVKVYLKSKTGATEGMNNALTLTEALVVTVDANFDLVTNPATKLNGNFQVEAKHSLRVSRDGAAPLGGSGAVNVYVKSAETVVALEAELKIKRLNYTVSASDVTVNSALFAGGVSASVSVTDSTVKVVALPTNPLDSIPASATERMLFSVVLHVRSDSASGGYDSLAASAIATTRDADFNTTAVTISAVTKGVFLIRSPFELQVQSKTASPQTEQMLNILLTNRDKVNAAQLVVKFDTTQLSYASMVTANEEIWTGGAPTPDVVSGGDSIKIGLLDLAGAKSIAAGGSGQKLVSIKFQLDPRLVNGDTAWISVSGVVAVVEENFDVLSLTASGIPGYIAVALDITPPGPVTEVTATAGDSSIALSWKNPTDSDLASLKVVRMASGMADVTVVLNEAPVAGATGSYEDTGVTTGVDYTYSFTAADGNGNESQAVTAGPVSIGPPPPETYIKAGNSIAVVGGVALNKIWLYSVGKDIAGVAFKVKFDATKLKVDDIMAGKDSSGLVPVGEINLDSANANGEFVLSALDLTGGNPIKKDGLREILIVKYMVQSAAAAGDSIPIMLESASLSDPDGADVPLTVTNGSVRVIAQVETDLTGDGITDARDLWRYFYGTDEVVFEALAAILAKMLAEPIPASLLAAAQDVVSTAVAADGAALINLNTDYEIIAARFTFSFDQSYGKPTVQLSQELAGKVMIKPLLINGKLVVDIISLSGLVPSQLGSAMFSVSFQDKDQAAAGLTLEKVETADRNGTVRIEAAKVNGASALPRAYALSQNSPNPFNPSTTISFEIPESNGGVKVGLTVYNIRGQKVITLVDELKEAGKYTVNWDGRDSSGNRVSSGVYFYRMQAGAYTATRKMVIVK